MSLTNGHGVLAYARAQRELVDAELERLGTQEAEHQRNRAQVQAALDSAWNHLVELLLPSLAPPALDAAASRLSLSSISAVAVGQRAKQRLHQLETGRTTVERDQRFITREARLNEIAIRSEELSDNIAPLASGVAALEAEPLFKQLIADNYGCPEYGRSWWQMSYYTCWKHADLVVEKHGPRLGVGDFAGIRARYLQESAALQTLRADRERLTSAAGEIQTLITLHAEAVAGLVSLDDWSLAMARGRAREHLAALPEPDFHRLFADDQALALAGKRVAGVAAKTRYLDAMASEWLGRSRQELQRVQNKLEVAVSKFRTSEKKLRASYEHDEVQSKYGVRPERWQDRSARYQHASRAVVVFQDYGACNTFSNYLWWDLMTGGHIKGSFIPEVAEHHAHARHDQDQATAALASSQGLGADQLSTMDAS